ncbi:MULTISPECIES: hypothetical protein [unclassified Luteococcus]|uniref:hypothetical protein n=1 Tax=unclassified Luteococcus TaxID=2639923 RepID=UPI00313C8DCE
MRRRMLAGLTVLALAAGCSAAPEASVASSSPQAEISAPADAVTLKDMMLTHGPSEFLLPKQVQVTSRIDQPNVVTLTFEPAQRKLLAGWLATRLPSGWSVDASANDSLLFHSSAWQGAFTCSATECALTLRKQAG